MRYKINPKYLHTSALIENIEHYFQQSRRVLYDQRNEIRVINFNSQEFVVKAFKVPNLINRIAYRYIRASKAKRSYEYSLKIGAKLTPEPVAYIEKNENFLLGKSYYISMHYDYDHTIKEVLANKALEDRVPILKAFSDFTYRLHEAEILHHDFSHGNILIKKLYDNGKTYYQFKIIDINRMDFHPLDLELRLANFARINADDMAMEVIINRYATLMGMASEQNKLTERAKFYRDDFYRKRAIKNKLRGKESL